MSFSTAILAALLGAVTTAGAGYYKDGNAILLDCTARDETLTTCLGYLDGIADAMQGMVSMGLLRASRWVWTMVS